jgi:hypothetical protein
MYGCSHSFPGGEGYGPSPRRRVEGRSVTTQEAGHGGVTYQGVPLNRLSGRGGEVVRRTIPVVQPIGGALSHDLPLLKTHSLGQHTCLYSRYKPLQLRM